MFKNMRTVLALSNILLSLCTRAATAEETLVYGKGPEVLHHELVVDLLTGKPMNVSLIPEHLRPFNQMLPKTPTKPGSGSSTKAKPPPPPPTKPGARENPRIHKSLDSEFPYIVKAQQACTCLPCLATDSSLIFLG